MNSSVPRLLQLLGIVPLLACGPGGPDFVFSLVDEARQDPARFSPSLAERLRSQPLAVAVEAARWNGSSPALNERVRVVAHERLRRAQASDITPDVVPELLRLAEGGEHQLISELAAAPASRGSLFSWIREADGSFAAYAAGAILKTARGFDEANERSERALAKKVLWEAYERERAGMAERSSSPLTCTLSEVSDQYCPELKAALVAAFEGSHPLFRHDLNAYADSSCPTSVEDMLRWAQHPDAALAATASAELLDRVAYRPQMVPSSEIVPVRAFLLNVVNGADAKRRDSAVYGLAHYVAGANEGELDEMLRLAKAEEASGLLAALTAMSAGARVEFAAQLAATDDPEELVGALVEAGERSGWALATLRNWAAGMSTRAFADVEVHYSHYYALQAAEKLFDQVFFPNSAGETGGAWLCGNALIELEQMMRDDLAALGLPPPREPERHTATTVDSETDSRAAQAFAEGLAQLEAARAAFIAYADAELARHRH